MVKGGASWITAMISSDTLQSFYWLFPLTLLASYLIVVILTGKQVKHPPLSRTVTLLPKFILNLVFARRAADLLQEGYVKFRNSAFYLVRNNERIVVLPLSLLEELAALPMTVASPQAALDHDLLGRYTGVNQILENRLHHTIVQRKLTPRIPLLLPRMEEAVGTAFEKCFPSSEDWTEFAPHHALGLISARVAADAIVGPAFCNDPTWLDVSLQYTENVFKTAAILRLLPAWMQRAAYPLLPSYWEAQRHLGRAKQLLRPRIQEIIEQVDAGAWEPQDDSADDANVLTWFSSAAQGRDRDPDVIAHALVLLALASVHTTLLRMVNVLYDVTAAGPGLRDQLLDEIGSVFSSSSSSPAAERGYGRRTTAASSYDRLHRLDSVLRESQRLSPPVTIGMKRVFLAPHTFRDGTRVAAGTYACLPIYAIENDEAHTPRPREFDGLRGFRARERCLSDGAEDDNNKAGAAAKEFLFATPTRTSLNFGYGKTACPGRFFASCAVKVVLVKMLGEYEFRFLPGSGRPKNQMFHEFLFPPAEQKILVRRRKGALSPF